jgi:hypothetical protein
VSQLANNPMPYHGITHTFRHDEADQHLWMVGLLIRLNSDNEPVCSATRPSECSGEVRRSPHPVVGR